MAVRTSEPMSYESSIEKIRAFLDTAAGKAAGIGLALLLLVVAYLMARPRNVAADAARTRIFICSETGKSFKVTLKEGLMTPVQSPYSGKETGYPAELCYW